MGNYIEKQFIVWAVRECGKIIINSGKTKTLKNETIIKSNTRKCLQVGLANNIYIVMITEYRQNKIYIPFIYNCMDRGQYLMSKIDEWRNGSIFII